MQQVGCCKPLRMYTHRDNETFRAMVSLATSIILVTIRKRPFQTVVALSLPERSAASSGTQRLPGVCLAWAKAGNSVLCNVSVV